MSNEEASLSANSQYMAATKGRRVMLLIRIDVGSLFLPYVSRLEPAISRCFSERERQTRENESLYTQCACSIPISETNTRPREPSAKTLSRRRRKVRKWTKSNFVRLFFRESSCSGRAPANDEGRCGKKYLTRSAREGAGVSVEDL